MSEYQRFISYMYEYRNGKKSTNCGYARVENRNRLCRLEIHMKTSPQTLEEPMRIYGCFHQDGWLFGILLGQHAPVLDMVNWRYQGDPDNLNASHVPLSQLEGLILNDGSQVAYCSMWNDTVIDPNQMTPYIKEGSTETPSWNMAKDTAPKEAASTGNIPTDAIDPPDTSSVIAANTPDSLSADTADILDPLPSDTEDLPDSPPVKTANMPNEVKAESILPDTEDADISDESSSIDPSDDDPPRDPYRENRPHTAIFNSNISQNTLPDENTPTNGSDNPSVSELFPADSSDNTSGRKQAIADDPDNGAPSESAPSESAPSESAPQDTVRINSKLSRPREQEGSLADTVLIFQQKQADQNAAETTPGRTASPSPWDQVQAAYPQINPFTDDEIQDCVRIELSDLPVLRQNGWRIAGNRFILHSFQKNRHLILGRLKNNGRYIFAVPGYYDNQERFMANMFGFPYFKSSDGGPLRYGQKGYWYRLLY